ncbi:hypothetical protein IQ249_15370 [Lusitaniella coriacea LEGE 07157]|uniref:Uncharacterized protein n=1 Tax=Lusitaniella coriacea LEGE 07157 TaxID=945747 RepID=A0A8J7JBZ8_9CYAN|nr:hypothetical protein [Lusitaniella coriacea]MBE9117280.1 hypothetical protein [Lusitaniella coriacea LEGE 07157]
MTDRSYWRKNRPISLPSEDNTRLERLKERAEAMLPHATYSLVVRAALKELAKLPNSQLRAALEALPRPRYGPEPKTPRPTLTEEEREALMRKLGLSS